MDIKKQISQIGIVPVVKIQDPKKAVPLAKALIDGGLPVAEITFRTEAALETISVISKELPQMLVGAGTVLTVEQAKKAKENGAKFIVSPGFNPKVVSWCVENEILATPGCTTPSEIEQALELGLDVVKFFPAEQSGGIQKIKALSAPYYHVKFIPTGGIDLKNLTTYLDCKKVIACGGSFMVKEEYIETEQWEKITELTREAVRLMLGFEIGHIGINLKNDSEALDVADAFSRLLSVPVKNGNSSVFAGSMIEAMKSPYYGENGHIAIRTNSVERAVYHLQRQGAVFLEESAKYQSDGTLAAIYLEQEIGGFAVHLVQK